MIEKIRKIIRNIRERARNIQTGVKNNLEKNKVVRKKRLKKLKKILKILLLVILGGLLLLIVFLIISFTRSTKGAREWIDQINRGEIPESIREMISDREVEISGDIWAKYRLEEGWNFVVFPIKPIGFNTASGLIEHVGRRGGYVTAVAMWDGDRWKEFSQRGGMQFGDDFSIESGKAYFLLNHRAVLWKIVGNPVKVGEYKLKKGWNSLGIIKDGLKASDVIDSINKDGEKAVMMSWRGNNNWEMYVKKINEEGNVEEVGENVVLEKTKGYMIYLKEPVSWRLE